MIRNVGLLYVLAVVLISTCTTHDNWDYYQEIPGTYIPDLGYVGVGDRVFPSSPHVRVKRLRIFIDIIHDVPSTLKINLVHEYYLPTDTIYDTLIIWHNDFPGDIQEADLDYFEDELARDLWTLAILDEVEDGNTGLLNEFILMIEYQ